jgi:hypothetical protein
VRGCDRGTEVRQFLDRALGFLLPDADRARPGPARLSPATRCAACDGDCGAAHNSRRVGARSRSRIAELGLEFSVGASFAYVDTHTALALLPAQAWTPAYRPASSRTAERREGEGVGIEPRDGAWVAEATGLLDLSAWPAGTRLILGKERPTPAQLRTTDAGGMRITGFLTNTAPTDPAANSSTSTPRQIPFWPEHQVDTLLQSVNRWATSAGWARCGKWPQPGSTVMAAWGSAAISHRRYADGGSAPAT